MERQDGLLYYPSRYNPPVGHAGFEVRLMGAPARRYFDACRALFPVEQSGALRRVAIEHPGRAADGLRFVAGRIRLEAFDGDTEEVVTFGGRVGVAVEGDETVCRVTSSAPFLVLDEGADSPVAVMEAELEAMLAQQRAAWGRDEYRHLDRLADVEPMTMFVASIRALEQRLTPLARADGDEATRRALHTAREIRRVLERAGEWPAAAVGLEELL